MGSCAAPSAKRDDKFITTDYLQQCLNGLYKAEVIHRKSWKKRAEVELATLTWVDWYNNRRLLGRLRHTPPAEAEKAYYASIGNVDLPLYFQTSVIT